MAGEMEIYAEFFDLPRGGIAGKKISCPGKYIFPRGFSPRAGEVYRVAIIEERKKSLVAIAVAGPLSFEQRESPCPREYTRVMDIIRATQKGKGQAARHVYIILWRDDTARRADQVATRDSFRSQYEVAQAELARLAAKLEVPVVNGGDMIRYGDFEVSVRGDGFRVEKPGHSWKVRIVSSIDEIYSLLNK